MNIKIGTGVFTLFALLFTGLKLTGYIDWSWLWVLAPIWIPMLGGLLIGGIVLILALVFWI